MAQPHAPGSPAAGDPSNDPAPGRARPGASAHVGPAAVTAARAAAAHCAPPTGLPADLRDGGFELALILGSGLGPLADEVEDAVSVPFAEVPGMPASTAPGHAGRFVLGRLSGRRVALMQGRLHAYEGYPASTCAFPVRVLHALGAERLVVTNACGGLDPHWRAGDLMLQLDFINHTFDHALTGPSDGVGPRFPVTFDAYDEDYLESARAAARRLDLRLREGVYLAIAGPAYATRAELRAFRAWGADAIGMSTVHEVTLARSLGMRVLGLSVVTDMALPDGSEHATGDEVLRVANLAGERFRALLRALLPEL
jgi:purine-nucleoside phosphorylase